MDIKIMQIYRYFKGGMYIVLHTATDEATGDILVIYQSLKNNRIWSRPIDVFLSDVPKDRENSTGQKKRFELYKIN